jgi:hypothetical protein
MRSVVILSLPRWPWRFLRKCQPRQHRGQALRCGFV